jgi:hypothetical protein
MAHRIAGPIAAAALGLGLAAGWLVPGEAEACSWVAMALPVSPQPQAQDVPVDVVITLVGFAWSSDYAALEPFTLHALDGAGNPVSPPVDITVEALPTLVERQFPIRVIPQAPLAASTGYRLTWTSYLRGGGTLHFETGTGTSAAPVVPTAPSSSPVPYDSSVGLTCRDSCWSYDVGGLVLEFGSAPPGTGFNLYEAGALVAADLGAKSTLSVACGSSTSGFLAPGAHTFEVRAVNAAGQESAPVQFIVEAECIANPGGNSPHCPGSQADGGDPVDGGSPAPGSSPSDGGSASGRGGCTSTGGATASWLIPLLLVLCSRNLRRALHRSRAPIDCTEHHRLRPTLPGGPARATFGSRTERISRKP